jgi:hypothetical protein
MKFQSFENPIELPDDTPIYKYMSTDFFLSFLSTQKLIFQCIPKWKDQLEGTLFEFAKQVKTEWCDFNKSDYFGSCWSLQEYPSGMLGSENERIEANKELAEHGSAAMWESYCWNGGVRIKTTIGKIKIRLTEVQSWHGAVQYKPLSSLLTGMVIRPEFLFFYKGVGYIHENEYRFVVKPKRKPADLFPIKFSHLSKFLDEILVYPTTKDDDWKSRALWELILRENIPEKIGGSSNNKNGKQFCRMSNLYDKKSHELK